MIENLVFDLGMHRGEDSEYYLKKNFRVVAVEANKELCHEVAQRLQNYVNAGQLIIVNQAIAPQPGEVTFFQNERSVWSTIDPEFALRNERDGFQNRKITVRATNLKQLIEEYGTPYFVKIDIEGMDMVALSGMTGAKSRPKYVSVESEKVSFQKLRAEFELFHNLGYNEFKVVPQHYVARQKLPNPAREGTFVDQKFRVGSSGAFGEEAPGEWITAEQAIDAYRLIFLRYALIGDDGYVQRKSVRRVLNMLRVKAGWYDTHARLAVAQEKVTT